MKHSTITKLVFTYFFITYVIGIFWVRQSWTQHWVNYPGHGFVIEAEKGNYSGGEAILMGLQWAISPIVIPFWIGGEMLQFIVIKTT